MKLRRIKEFVFLQFRIIMGHRFGFVGAVIIIFFCLVALLATYLAPHQPWDTLRDATGNWWGTPNPRTIGERIYDFNDNNTQGPVVDYLDFLDGGGGSPVRLREHLHDLLQEAPLELLLQPRQQLS